MKFLDFYLSSGTRTMSTLIGTVAGLVTALFAGWEIGVIVGASVVIVASVVIPILLYREEKPYTKAKEAIKQPFLIDERVRFTVKDGTVGGYFLLTDDQLILLSLDKGEHRLELTRENVTSVILGDQITLNIFLNQKQYIRVISGVCHEMYDVLTREGWIRD